MIAERWQVVFVRDEHRANQLPKPSGILGSGLSRFTELHLASLCQQFSALFGVFGIGCTALLKDLLPRHFS